MAKEEIERIIHVKVTYKELISGMTKLAGQIDKTREIIAGYKKEIEGLNADYKKRAISEEEYSQRINETQMRLKAAQETLKSQQNTMREYSREVQANIKEEKQLSDSVNGLRASIRKLTAEYNNLSAAEREGAKGMDMAKRINEMQMSVNKAEQGLGNFRSNVGNYQSAFNGLNVAMSQIVRELPAATMGVNMFFLAISNNIPMLVDEINKLRAANKIARQEGKAGVSIVKQLASSLFSWNTVLTVGITLLTVYGKDIANWISSLFKGRAAALSMADAQAQVNDRLKESSGSYGSQVAQLKILQTQWNSLGGSLEDKKKFIEDNKESFDKLGVSVATVAEADNLFIKNTDAFIEAMALRAEANAANELATEKYKEALIAEEEAEKKIEEGATETVWKSANGAGSYQTKVRREYTEEEKESILSEVNALRAEADAFAALKVARDADAKSILDRAGIVEYDAESEKNREKAAKAQAKTPDDTIQKWIESQRNAIRREGPALIDEFEKLYSTIGKDITADMQAQFAAKQDEYRNRILNAQVTGGDVAAQNETIAILQEQIQSIETFQGVYEAMGYSAVQIDNMRLEKLKELQDAMSKGTATTKQGMQESFQAVSQLAGALSGLAEESGASAGIVAMLGMAQAIASMGAALSKAFTTGVTIWDSLAGVASAIAAITTVISQMKTLNSTAAGETSKYRYARGGLVTGPGTGTSDSIPAQLSNGEAVMTAQAVIDWGPVLSMMNVASGGNAIPTRHLPDRQFDMEDMLTRAMEKALGRMPSPVVSVRDINKGQRRVKVQDELARYRKKS